MVSTDEYTAVASSAHGQEPFAMANGSADSNRGQGHDRILPYHDATNAPLPTTEPRGGGGNNPSSDGNSVPRIEQVTIGQKMLSAVAGSVVTSVLVTPLDVVRVRLQSQQTQPSFSEIRLNNSTPFPRSFKNLPPDLGVTACCREVFWVTNNAPYCVVEGSTLSITQSSADAAAAADCAVEESQRRTFTSTLDGLRKIARNEGITTLWRGLSPTLVMAVPGNVIYFAGYDWLRTSSSSPLVGRVSDTYSPLVAGSVARVIAAFFVSPIELFRTRMQASQSRGNAAENFYETARGVREMVANQGIPSLWRGLSLTLWRDVPFSALYWWGYEFTRNIITDARERGASSLLNSGRSSMDMGGESESRNSRASSRSRQNHTSTLIDSFASGAISGGVASVITTPFDVGKTRQQVFRYSGDSASSSNGAVASSQGVAHQNALQVPDRSMPRLLLHIFKEEGFSGLFRGWAARVLKVAPACAIMISSYEIGKKMAAGIVEPEDD